VQATVGATGHLVILNRDAEGAVRLIFPNPHSSRAPTGVRAGQVVYVPEIGRGFQFEIKKDVPRGLNEIIALVVPEEGLAEFLREFQNKRSTGRSDELLEDLGRRIEATATPGTARAVGTRQFVIED
jgi:hypothetical protein